MLYNFFKDALIEKNGFLKIYWDESETIEHETYRSLTPAEKEALNDTKDEIEVIEEEIFDKPQKKKRVLTEAQKEALAKGRAKAKALREKQKEQEKTNTDKVKRRAKTKKQIERAEAVGKRVHRNANQKKFEDAFYKIAENFDDEKQLDEFTKHCENMSYDDFATQETMKNKLASIIKLAMEK